LLHGELADILPEGNRLAGAGRYFIFKETTMSSVSSTGSFNPMISYSGTSGMKRPSADQMAEKLFSKLDTSGKGYIEQSDLESAFSGLASTSTTRGTNNIVSASEIFSQLDGDGDGKITQTEMTASLQKLSEALDSQFNQIRMQGGMPPPPPAEETDSGFTKEELTSQLAEIGSSDSERSSLISKIVQNFDEADTDGDGKVSLQEAMAYDQATNSENSTPSSIPDTSSTQNADAKVFHRIMELMRAYGNSDTGNDLWSQLSASISTSA
jgi:Ca2+-binding EF-hand superfamily protein